MAFLANHQFVTSFLESHSSRAIRFRAAERQASLKLSSRGYCCGAAGDAVTLLAHLKGPLQQCTVQTYCPLCWPQEGIYLQHRAWPRAKQSAWQE